MNSRSRMRLAIATLALVVTACNPGGWYEGMNRSAREECAKSQEPCPDAPTYEQYRTERDKLKKEDSGATPAGDQGK